MNDERLGNDSRYRRRGTKRRQAAALVRLKAQVVGEVKVLFRQTLSGL
jgi:hypothetical protein